MRLLIIASLLTFSFNTMASLPTGMMGSWSGNMSWTDLADPWDANSAVGTGTDTYNVTITSDLVHLIGAQGTSEEWFEKDHWAASNNNTPMNTYVVAKNYENLYLADMTGYCVTDRCNVSYSSIQTREGVSSPRTYVVNYELMDANTLRIWGERLQGALVFMRWEATLTKDTTQ